jgi:hypothetical protein
VRTAAVDTEAGATAGTADKWVEEEDNMNKSIIFLLTAITLLFFSNVATAQLSYTLSSDVEYNTNPFRTPDRAESQFITSFNGGIQQTLGNSKILYFGRYALFTKSPERNFYWHQLGFYNETASRKYGVYAEQRINKADFNFFDYTQFTAYGEYKYLNSFGFLKVLGSANYKTYSNLSLYSNYYFTGGFYFNKSFETKTTIIIQSILNYKNYLNAGTVINPVAEHRWRMRPPQTTSAVTTSQISSFVKVAQSLFTTTGLSVYYQNRNMLGSSGAIQADLPFSFGNESDLYDDPMSRFENTVGAEVTQILPWMIIGKAGFSYGSRSYPSQGIYTNDTNYVSGTERVDKQSSFYFKLNKVFTLDETKGIYLNTEFNYSAIKNESNSYWYNYKSNQLVFTIGLNF